MRSHPPPPDREAQARFARTLPPSLESMRRQFTALAFGNAPAAQDLSDALDAAWVSAVRLAAELDVAPDKGAPALKTGR